MVRNFLIRQKGAAGEVEDYMNRFVEVEVLEQDEKNFRLKVNLVVTDRLIELVKSVFDSGDGGNSKEMAPEVASAFPLNGATGVDPAVSAITVTFNQPMTDHAYSFCRINDNFPETAGSPFYNADCTTVTLPVRLEPNKTYEIYLNYGNYRGFFSARGVPLKGYHYTFSTGSGK